MIIEQMAVDCKISSSTIDFISIIRGTASPLELFKSGKMIVNNMEKLALFGKSFKFEEKEYEEYRMQELAKIKTLSMSMPSLKSSGEESSAKIPMSTAVTKYFSEVIGEDHILTKLLKVCNSATISPAMIELKMALGQKYMTKDVPNSWNFEIRIVFKQDKFDSIQIQSCKSEIHIEQLFDYTWELIMDFNNTMDFNGARLTIPDLDFADSEKAQLAKGPVKDILNPYSPVIR